MYTSGSNVGICMCFGPALGLGDKEWLSFEGRPWGDRTRAQKDIERPHKHKDPTKQYVWYPPDSGPWNQNVRSSCLCGLVGP